MGGNPFLIVVWPTFPFARARALSLFLLLFRTSRPHTCVIRRPDGSIKVSVKPQIN